MFLASPTVLNTMDETSWAQQAVDSFFAGRKCPTQTQCIEIARSISGFPNVYDVDTPGSMSYTVVCKDVQPTAKPETVVSFRQPEAHIDESMAELAGAIHGSLVPKPSRHGQMNGADPPLAIYTMPYVPGISCLDALACHVDMDDATEARHASFIRHLARLVTLPTKCTRRPPQVLRGICYLCLLTRYFARCWSNPQCITSEARAESLRSIQRKLTLLKTSSSILGTSAVSELERNLPELFAQEYPQVLTHGDLSRTNILVDESTFNITGIVDWSLAAVLPFGLELDSLFLTTGYMDRHGWHDYACRSRLHQVFWNEFWSNSEITNDDGRRAKIRHMAEQAARIGAILRYAFQRNADGSPSEALVSDGAFTLRYLQAWVSS